MPPAKSKPRPKKPRLGSTEPRIFTPPLRKLTPETSAGFLCIEFAAKVLGIELLPWQKWLLIHALELLPDGTFRFRTVVILVGRQNGKSTLMQVLALFFMFVRGAALVIGTAQNLDIAEEVWQGAVDIAQEVPELAVEIADVKTANGKTALILEGGERYKVQTASRRGGRGLTGDLILLDELREHQSWDAWSAVTKTTTARAFAQIWAASNAGDATSVVLRYLRKVAHAFLGDPDRIGDELLADETEAEDLDVGIDDGEEESLGIFEWSAVPGCRLDDREQWALANPSLGYTITERVIAGFMRTDPEWVFRTETLCQWSDGSLEGPFPPGSWEAGRDGPDPKRKYAGSRIAEDSTLAFCVDVAVHRTRAHVAVAGFRADGRPHVEIIASRAGVDWLIPWFTERADEEKHPEYGGFMNVTAQTKGAPVSADVPDLEAIDGVNYIPWEGGDLGRATAQIYDAVKVADGKGLAHLPQPVLDVAAATAAVKLLADGAIAWDRMKSATDAAPLVAATGALWVLNLPEEDEQESAYEDNGLMVV